MSNGATDDEKKLRLELREVAKRGLDDPALLIDLDGLLQLASMSRTERLTHSQNESSPIQRCITLTSALTEVLSELSQSQDVSAPSADGSPSRTEVIDGLFMLSDEWKGLKITNRREKLARVEPEQDTSGFRRGIEEPLYDLVLSHLRRWTSDAEIAAQPRLPSDDSQIDVEMLCTAVYRALCAAQAIANPERPDQKHGPHGGEGDYWALEMLLTACEAKDDCLRTRPTPADRDTIHPEMYDSWYLVIGWIDNMFSPGGLLPFTRRELSSCLSEFKKGVGPLRDYLDDHPRGGAILQRWRAWLSWDDVPNDNIVSFMTGCTESAQELLTVWPLSADQRFKIEHVHSTLVRYLIDEA